MNFRSSFKSIAAGALIAAASASAPAMANITYVGTRTTDRAGDTGCCAVNTATLSLTTDGTLGALATSNLLAWSINLNGLYILDQTNSTFQQLLGASLFATVNDISFDFGRPAQGAVYFERAIGGDYAYYCLETRSTCGSARGEAETIDSNLDFRSGSNGYSHRVGNVVIASVPITGGVPEPSLWATMILGFGLVGATLRRRGRNPKRLVLRRAL